MFKIVLMGDNRVGKTSLRSQYMGEGFRTSYQATLGVDYSVKKTKFGNAMVYDLAGDRTSSILRKQQYHNSNGAIMVFSIVNRESFENLNYWVEELSSTVNLDFPIFILGNKDDLRDTVDDPVKEEEGYEFSKNLGNEFNISASYLTTSALTGYNVEVAFNKLFIEITNKE